MCVSQHYAIELLSSFRYARHLWRQRESLFEMCVSQHYAIEFLSSFRYARHLCVKPASLKLSRESEKAQKSGATPAGSQSIFSFISSQFHCEPLQVRIAVASRSRLFSFFALINLQTLIESNLKGKKKRV
jgi:hypothetical protein